MFYTFHWHIGIIHLLGLRFVPRTCGTNRSQLSPCILRICPVSISARIAAISWTEQCGSSKSKSCVRGTSNLFSTCHAASFALHDKTAMCKSVPSSLIVWKSSESKFRTYVGSGSPLGLGELAESKSSQWIDKQTYQGDLRCCTLRGAGCAWDKW